MKTLFPNAIRLLLLAFLAATMFSCQDDFEKPVKSESLPSIFPDYTDVTVPVNIAPLNFKLPGAKRVRAEVFLENERIFDIKSDSVVKFPTGKWKDALKKAAGKELTVIVTAKTSKNTHGIRYKSFNISVSADEIDPWIAYRLIPPGYELWKRMGIYQRNLTNFDEEAIVKNSQNDGGCINCHNFCQYDPSVWMFHSRNETGGTVITYKGVSRKIAIERIGPLKGATYPAWHPSGRYIAFSSNVTRQMFYGISRDKIEVFDNKSDLIIYDVHNGKVLADPRFNEECDFETFPSFSPDGKYLYYCVGSLCPDMEKKKSKAMFFEYLKYAICRVPFNEANGELGEKVDTVYSAYKEGGSASFPRISPDGKYMLFTLANCATFPIQHVEADLKMKNLSTLEDVDTKILNSDYSDSYHSWSSNGRWIVFSSKRVDGRYTRLFFSHCYKDGRFTKPFLLPQRNPDHNAQRLNAYNIPEFIKAKVVVDKDKMSMLLGT